MIFYDLQIKITRGSQKVISTKFQKIGERWEESEINFIINYIRKASFLHMLPQETLFLPHNSVSEEISVQFRKVLVQGRFDGIIVVTASAT